MIEEKSGPILYSFRRCPYAMRARWALFLSSQECIIRELVLRDKPKHMLEISPKGTVPVLLLPTGQVIDESLDIMLWTLGNSDPKNLLTPESTSLDEALTLIKFNDTEFKYHLDRYKYPNRYEGAVAEYHRTEAEKFFAQLEEKLTHNAYLFGSRPCIADYALAPFLRQFRNTDTEWFSASKYHALIRWLENLLTTDGFRIVMKKYPLYNSDESAHYFFPPSDKV